MRVFSDPRDPRRDRCVFSKGHAVLAQYAAFAELGYVSREDLKKAEAAGCIPIFERFDPEEEQSQNK